MTNSACTTPLTHIRPANAFDVSRIAEIIIMNYRQNFYPIFKDEDYYFRELNVLDMATEYQEGSDNLNNTYVYDDGVVKGIIRVEGAEIQKLFVEPQFQNQHIGEKLLNYVTENLQARYLWVLEYNKSGIAFYERHGFKLTGERVVEDEYVPLQRMEYVH